MDRQERNEAFIEGYKKVLQENDAKLIVGIGRNEAGKTFIVMDFDNSISDIMDSLRQFVEGLEKLPKGKKS